MPNDDIQQETISDDAHGRGYAPGASADWGSLNPKTIGEALDILRAEVASGLQNIVEDLTPQLGGELDAQKHTIGFTLQTATGDGTGLTIDWKKGNKFLFTWGAFDEVLTFVTPSKPCNLVLEMKQDSVGGRDATIASITWMGTAPVFTDGGADKTIIVLIYYNGTKWWGATMSWEP